MSKRTYDIGFGEQWWILHRLMTELGEESFLDHLIHAIEVSNDCEEAEAEDRLQELLTAHKAITVGEDLHLEAAYEERFDG